MGYTVFYGGHNPNQQFDRESWDQCGTDYQVKNNIEKTSCAAGLCHRRRRRFWCASPTSSKIGWKSDGTGGAACGGVGTVTGLGGGEAGFTGKDQHFPGKFAGYKCEVVTPRKCAKMGTKTVTVAGMRISTPFCKSFEDIPMGTQLKTWSSDSKMTTAGANDNDRKFKSLYDQIVFGIKTQYGTSTGFCADAKNLSTVVHNDGRTCYEMLSAAGEQADADTKTRSYCESSTGRMDEKCKCFNVTGSGFLENCRANPKWSGCKELIPRITELETLLKSSNLTVNDIGNADCIVPDICGKAGTYIPNTGKPVCETKMEVCNQVMQQDNVKAYGDLESIQSCNFTGANSLDKLQQERDAAKNKASGGGGAAPRQPAPGRRGAAPGRRGAGPVQDDYRSKKDKRIDDAIAARNQKAAAGSTSTSPKPGFPSSSSFAARKLKAKAAAGSTSTSPEPGSTSTSPEPGSTSSDSLEDVPTPSGSPAPSVGDGLAKPGGMPQQTQIGLAVGGVVMLISCLLFLMMMMGGRSKR